MTQPLNYSKFRLVLGGALIGDFSREVIKELIRLWVENSHVRNVPSGRIRCDLDHRQGVVIYSAYFDSSHWTGIDYDGCNLGHWSSPKTDFSGL